MNRREALKKMGYIALGSAAAVTGFDSFRRKAVASLAGESGPVEKNPKNMDIMKVLLINGSPNREGCTFTALSEIAGALARSGVDSEIHWLGKKPVNGCMGCGACRKDGLCVVDDQVNEVIKRAYEFDGFVFGTPVHYAAASGFITPFLDRLFYAGGRNLSFKPGAAVASCRRAGSSATLDQLNKYFTINNMPVVSSQYWNMVHGNTPDEVRQDLEGMQIMRTLGTNMAWLIRCIDAGRRAGIGLPEHETRVGTNFIR